MALEHTTLRETVARLTTDYGIRDYLHQFYLIHEASLDDSDGTPSEGAFVRRMTEAPDPNQMEFEKLFKRTNPMIRQTLRLFALISPLPVDGKAVTPESMAMKAFHESLFQLLFQVRFNLRRMFELAFDCENDPDEFIGNLIDKYDLAAAEVEAFSTDWIDTYEGICQGLLNQSMLLRIFSGDDVHFRLDDEDGNPTLKLPRYLMTANQLVISKDFFFLQILTVLKHVEVMTKISSLEKEQPYDDGEIQVIEMFEMDAIFPIAEALLDRE